MISVRETCSNRLINEEHVSVLVPGVRVESDVVGALRPTRPQFHEETCGSGTPGSAIDPEDNIVVLGVAPASKKVEEKVASFYVNVTSVSTGRGMSHTGRRPRGQRD